MNLSRSGSAMKEKKKKEKYEKPELNSIHLLADEVLALGCKTGSSGPGGATCASVPCSELGS